MRIAASFSLLLLVAGHVVAARQAEAIETIVRAEMAAQRIPGMAVAVIRQGAIVKPQGYGLANVEHNVSVTEETIFQSGSLGEQFTAAAVMLQVEDGKIALTDPLTTFFPDGPSAWRDITVRHLLTHTSGIPDYTDGRVDYWRDYTVQRHGGAWQGFKTYIARYLGDDITIVALANLAQANPGRVVKAIANSLMPQLTSVQSWTIRGAQIADGTGAPLRHGDLRIVGDTIVAVGSVTPEPHDRLVDATGLVLAPGFVDAHNHSTSGLDTDPDAVTQISQGITTVLLGQDGSSPFPVRDYLAKRRATPTTLNAALLVGHATIRREVLGEDFKRAASAAEVKRMETLVDQEMRDGAIGLSSGLEYEVGSYASTEELVSLAGVAAKHAGFYISHIRDEADRTIEAVREAIAIGEKAKLPVQITHLKLGTVGVWGKASEVAAIVDAARKRGVDVTADVYPYLAWSSNLKVLVPNKRWTDPASVKEALDDVGGGRNIQITRLPTFPQYVGKRLDEIATAEGLSEVDLYIRIVQDHDAGVIGHTMAEHDMRAFLRQPWAMVASDGGIGMSHPRGAGTFPRVLGRFVRDEKWLTLPEAIRKMTSMPAARLGLHDRGIIRAGMKADLVLFDPATIIDRSTFEQPRLRSRGIYRVFVNGEPVWTGDAPEENRPGRVLTRMK